MPLPENLVADGEEPPSKGTSLLEAQLTLRSTQESLNRR
jgi:hypothetical protein